MSAFDPSANAADATALVGDTAPAEFRYDFVEAPTRVCRTLLVRQFLVAAGYPTATLAVCREVADFLAGSRDFTRRH